MIILDILYFKFLNEAGFQLREDTKSTENSRYRNIFFYGGEYKESFLFIKREESFVVINDTLRVSLYDNQRLLNMYEYIIENMLYYSKTDSDTITSAVEKKAILFANKRYLKYLCYSCVGPILGIKLPQLDKNKEYINGTFARNTRAVVPYTSDQSVVVDLSLQILVDDDLSISIHNNGEVFEVDLMNPNIYQEFLAWLEHKKSWNVSIRNHY